MNTELIRLELSNKLSQHFSVQAVNTRVVNPYKLRNNELQNKFIVAFEFIINRRERYLTFGMESPQTGEIVFTRPKEGISDFLSPAIRPHDFRYSLTGDVNNRFDVVGRFIESWISMRALHEMKSTIQSFADNINPDIDYCLGYKVTAHHKHSKTYDSRFEILVRKGNEDKYTTFNGEFRNGQLHYVSANDEIVTMEDVFGV
ncbi:hypothetical protein PQD71_gp171 [Kosakonia phage Kc263]|uniref:Uncharacterized protein n=1 Tax=Kosakonia phage Kc263 TaxID=2863194 RepID=A0AAE8BIM4_9CAUD|nr:hypothetical protein PQD71_gp171 [Kosakonia phage Kc263]QYN80064.1 hypothetical protein [Kosakonia phage Kc263]